MKTFLLAAGFGSRLKPYTLKRPKPMIPFLGLPLINFSLAYAKIAGSNNFLINSHHLHEQLHSSLSNEENVKFSFEKEKPLGTVGGILHAKSDLISIDHFFLLNTDIICFGTTDNLLGSLSEFHKSSGSSMTLLCTSHPDLGSTLNPVWTDADNNICGFGNTAPEKGLVPVHYSGYQCLSQSVINYLQSPEEHIFYDTVKNLQSSGLKVKAHIKNLSWWETGNFNGLLNAHTDILNNFDKYENTIIEVYRHAKIHWNYHIVKSDNGICFKPVDLDINFSFEGTIVLGAKTRVKNGVHLSNIISESGATINESMDNCLILRN